MTKLTDAQVMSLLRSDGPFNRARAQFSSHSAKIEQASQQRQHLSPIEMRRMEFEAVQEIAAAFRYQLVDTDLNDQEHQ